MATNRIIFFATSVQPNPEEVDYWIDLTDNPYGGSIKYFNGVEWIELSATSGQPDLSNYYNKQQVNNLLNTKASTESVQNKADKAEVNQLVKDVTFSSNNPNATHMVLLKYDGSEDYVELPIASSSTAGIVTSKDFIDFVKQHQLQELHTEMIELLADIRSKYQKKLIAGKNIYIDQDTNVISASGDISIEWDNIIHKPDFKPISTSGDYNDLTNKLVAGKDVNIDENNVITITIDSDNLANTLADLQTTLQEEIDRSVATDATHNNAINKEIQDRKDAIATEVNDRNAAILVETNRAKAKEEELSSRITDHESATNAALALKADKSDTYTKAQVDAKLSGAYKVKGSSRFEDLPIADNVIGDVYNITNAFTLNGNHYNPGTNIVWTENGWDPLSGSFDTTAIEGSIQDIADDLATEVLNRTQADTAINNNLSSLTTRVVNTEDQISIINGNESTTGSINKALKDAKDYADDKVIRGSEVLYDTTVMLVDETQPPLDVVVYTKEQVDSKITVDSETNNYPTSLLVDENASLGFQVYTKAEINAIIEKLKSDNNLI